MKQTFVTVSFQQIFWMITLGATTFQQLAVGRFIAGITGGGMLVTISVFVSEIANKQLVDFI